MKTVVVRYCNACGHIGELPKNMLKCCPQGPGELIPLSELKQAVEIGFATMHMVKYIATKRLSNLR